MDQITKYKKIIRELVEHYGSIKKIPEEVQTLVAIDEDHGQYLLYNSGWKDDRRNYGCFLHIGVKDGKVHLYHDGTNLEIGAALLQLGIPKEDLVLEFHAPSKRAISGYAAA